MKRGIIKMETKTTFFQKVRDENFYLYEKKYFLWNRVFAFLNDILFGAFSLAFVTVLFVVTYGLW